MTPFFIFDNECNKLIISIGNVSRTIDYSELYNKESFFYEIFSNCKNINVVQNCQSMDRKAIQVLIDGIADKNHHSVEKVISTTESTVVEDVAQQDPEESKQFLISKIGRMIVIDEMDIKLKEPGDFVDLSIYDKERIDKCKELKFFINQGHLVYATGSEVSKIKSEYIAKKKKDDEESLDDQIIEREKEDQDNEDPKIFIEKDIESSFVIESGISDVEFGSIGQNEQEIIDSNQIIETGDAQISAGEIFDFFENSALKGMKIDADTIADDSESIDRLIHNT